MKNININWRHFILGIALNILVAIAFVLIYYAYIKDPFDYQVSSINYEAFFSRHR